jgi:hypothetical protein
MQDKHADYITREFGELVGKTIKAVRPLVDSELESFYWDRHGTVPFVIVFTDGTCASPSRDPEGNGAGFMFLADMA